MCCWLWSSSSSSSPVGYICSFPSLPFRLPFITPFFFPLSFSLFYFLSWPTAQSRSLSRPVFSTAQQQQQQQPERKKAPHFQKQKPREEKIHHRKFIRSCNNNQTTFPILFPRTEDIRKSLKVCRRGYKRLAYYPRRTIRVPALPQRFDRLSSCKSQTIPDATHFSPCDKVERVSLCSENLISRHFSFVLFFFLSVKKEGETNLPLSS